MKINVKTFVLATAFFTSSWPACFEVRGQNPDPSASPASAADKAKSGADAAAARRRAHADAVGAREPVRAGLSGGP